MTKQELIYKIRTGRYYDSVIYAMLHVLQIDIDDEARKFFNIQNCILIDFSNHEFDVEALIKKYEPDLTKKDKHFLREHMTKANLENTKSIADIIDKRLEQVLEFENATA